MKILLMIAAFALTTSSLFAQEKTKSNSKWKETKNGVTYEMEVDMKGTSTKNVEKLHITLNFKGNTDELTKVAFTKEDDLYVTIPVIKGGQNINIEPGLYTFKVAHQKLGEQKFEVELKRNDYKEITLTVK